MGMEARCQARVGGRWQDVTARLEDKEIVLRGEMRLRAPLDRIKAVRSQRGVLSFRHDGQELALRLGAQAERWAARIAHPPSRLDKLGVEPGQRVSVLGFQDPAFVKELKARGARVTAGRALADADLVFLFCAARAELRRLPGLARSIVPHGAIWVLWTKGGKHMREQDVRDVMDGPGLVDVKVVSFSDTLSGLKLMIRRERRPAAAVRHGKEE
jgi:hypothetical protein